MTKKLKQSNGSSQALIYCRVSTQRQQDEGTSLDSQGAACAEHARKLGYRVGRVTKEVYSGAELWDRPLLTHYRAALRAGEFQALVCYATDRLTRNPIHLALIAEECERAGIELIFATEPLDTSPEGALIRYVRGYAAQIEREKIKERALRGKRERAKSGKVHSWGIEMYGYRRDKEKGVRVVFEPEAIIVRQIFSWIVESGMSGSAVARLLNKRGVPTPSSGKRKYRDSSRGLYWCQTSVRVILRESAYKGEAEAWRWTRTNRQITARPESERVKLSEDVVPAIVSRELWEAAQVRLQANRADWTRNQKRPDLLRGHIFCAICGRRMTGEMEHGKRWVYRCSSRFSPHGACGGKRIPAAPCEDFVWERVSAILNEPQIITAELKRLQDEGPDAQLQADLESAKRELARIEKGQQRLISRFRQATEDDLWPLIEREVAQAEREKGQFKAVVAEIESRLASQAASVLNLECLSAYCARVREQLETFGFDEKRLALESLGARLTAASDREWGLEVTIPIRSGVGDSHNML
jgi:site-specific DNA recombinase